MPYVCVCASWASLWELGKDKCGLCTGYCASSPHDGGDFSFKSQMLRLAQRKPHSGVLAPESSSSLLGGQPLLEKDYINQPHVSIADLFMVSPHAVEWWDNVYSESLSFQRFKFFLISECQIANDGLLAWECQLPSLDRVPPERSYSDPTLNWVKLRHTCIYRWLCAHCGEEFQHLANIML